MGTKRGNRRVIDVLFTLSLFCVFAAASLIVVYIGADVYRSTIHSMDIGFEVNTTLTFVSTKMRQHDIDGGIRIDTLEGQNALVLEHVIGEAVFETWIFHYDGFLRELFINQENTGALALWAGQELIRVYAFDISVSDEHIVTISARSTDGTQARKLIGIRTAGV